VKVKLTHFYGREPFGETTLARALAPDYDSDGGGAVENAHDLARECSNAIGRLMEALVEQKMFTIEQAQTICGINSMVKIEEVQ
jgi:hypothetical protein